MVCSWLENLPRHEIPPRWMWPFPEELNQWFERVETNRRNGVKPDEDAPGTSNELEDEWRSKHGLS